MRARSRSRSRSLAGGAGSVGVDVYPAVQAAAERKAKRVLALAGKFAKNAKRDVIGLADVRAALAYMGHSVYGAA